MPTSSLVLGGGCFWCLDAAYRTVPGVLGVISGYAGGHRDHPSYEEVCAGTTGHAEVVKIDFDPARVSRTRLLDIFWQVHDATQVGGQGNDIGTQYRSVMFYSDEEERGEMERSRDREQARAAGQITTEILPIPTFWPAEEYHQDYFRRHPDRGYCAAVIRPKLWKLKSVLTNATS